MTMAKNNSFRKKSIKFVVLYPAAGTSVLTQSEKEFQVDSAKITRGNVSSALLAL
jgi:hypothetical protein